MRLFNSASVIGIVATLLSSVESGLATTGKAYPWDVTVGSSTICNTPGGFQHGKPYVALFPDAFTSYSLCNRVSLSTSGVTTDTIEVNVYRTFQWVRITNTANGQSAYGQVVDQAYTGDIPDLHLAYTFYSSFAFVGTTPSFNITWDYMPAGWNP
ncbi:hypothetical protein BKA70DRAFT_1435618 [Coprinopsis sp. MPI-PUGE-AT-0042]|nr:hypothetical protein BKA70DRAFT_1435618 [Coprinopsis sp. MPI-PUGE-AT-0042]